MNSLVSENRHLRDPVEALKAVVAQHLSQLGGGDGGLEAVDEVLAQVLPGVVHQPLVYVQVQRFQEPGHVVRTASLELAEQEFAAFGVLGCYYFPPGKGRVRLTDDGLAEGKGREALLI